MPIKEENKKLYPANWNEIREAILKRANNRCEFCGVENHIKGFRTKSGQFLRTDNNELNARIAECLHHKIFKIVLTIAHLDHNPKNNSPENLRALCQKCHLNYDKKHHAETRRKTLQKKKEINNGKNRRIKI